MKLRRTALQIAGALLKGQPVKRAQRALISRQTNKVHNLADRDSKHALIDFIIFGRNHSENSYRMTCADALHSIYVFW